MKMNRAIKVGSGLLAASLFGLAACEAPPLDTVQRGYRGTGMELVYTEDATEAKIAANPPQPVQPEVPGGGPKARDAYKNVQVLGDLSVSEFVRFMTSMTEWVSPEQGCTYCHAAGDDMSSDSVYTKKVARVMIAMTQRANEDWGEKHVGGEGGPGVTCWTCHRGNVIPEYVWAENPGYPHAKGLAPAQQNVAGVEAVAYASLPYDPFTPYLDQSMDIRMQSDTALPAGNRKSIKQTEWTYALMMHFSDSLDANCTYCHNSRAFGNWEQSPPTRVTAWHGIRMVREMNNKYIEATTDWLPDYRKGPLGDPLKVNCMTCHQQAYKPLLGQPVLNTYESALGVKQGVAIDMAKDG